MEGWPPQRAAEVVLEIKPAAATLPAPRLVRLEYRVARPERPRSELIPRIFMAAAVALELPRVRPVIVAGRAAMALAEADLEVELIQSPPLKMAVVVLLASPCFLYQQARVL